MKIKLITGLLSLFLSIGLFGQDRGGYTTQKMVGISFVNEAATISRDILAAAGLEANFAIAEANVMNALAVLRQGKRYVLYNPGFINKLTELTGTRWAAVSVLAHEIGHHLYNSFSGKTAQGLATELEADEFSGYVLEKMGASLKEAQVAINLLATPYATLTHPARNDRVNSIANGYQLAGGIVPEPETTTEEVVSTEPQRYRDNRNENNAPTIVSVLAKLVFHTAPGKDYYITSRLNIVQVEDNEVALLGKLSRSADESFPYIILATNGYRLYISSGGQIVNAKGDVVGKVTKA